MARPLFPLSAIVLLLIPSTASALCYYRGELYAKTTLEQEYRDAKWVVRARVLSAAEWQNGEARGTLYRLEVVDLFKGKLPQQFLFSTERNSGGFYLDDKRGRPDVGGEYLLFLVPNLRQALGPPLIRNSLWVNYSCGQSRPWWQVAQEEKSKLLALSHHR